jgi:hypothetical protein
MPGDPYATRSATQRGYGVQHQRLRQEIAAKVQAGQAWCCECGRWIHPEAPWHLAHDHFSGGYRGPAHERCNVGERNKRHARKRRPRPRYSRAW